MKNARVRKLLWISLTSESNTNSTSETITLQTGQCGNQVALQYWNQLAIEHGIAADGSASPYPSNTGLGFRAQGIDNENDEHTKDSNSGQYRDDRPELFFTLSDNNKYTPRSVLIDLEPSVISKCVNSLPMYNPRNIHLSEQGSGAGNNWKHGYEYGQEKEEELLNLIDREVDKCDNLANFQLFHSVAGGTGSGVGSLLLEKLSDRYGSKKLASIFAMTSKILEGRSLLRGLVSSIYFKFSNYCWKKKETGRIEGYFCSLLQGLSEQFNERPLVPGSYVRDWQNVNFYLCYTNLSIMTSSIISSGA